MWPAQRRLRGGIRIRRNLTSDGTSSQPPSRGNSGTTATPARSAEDWHDCPRHLWRVAFSLLHLERVPNPGNQEPIDHNRASLEEDRTKGDRRGKADRGS